MRGRASNLSAAFGNIWALAGLLVSAVSIFNWLVGVVDLPLATVVIGLLGALRQALYPIVNFLFGWLDLTDVWRDGIIVYAAGGAAMLRTLARGTFEYARSIWPESLTDGTSRHLAWGAVLTTFFGTVVAYALWPLAILYILFYPLEVERDGRFAGFWGADDVMVRTSPDGYIVRADLRIVFTLQLFAIALLLALFAIFNLVAVS